MADKVSNALLIEVLAYLNRLAREPAPHAEAGPLADRLAEAMAASAAARARGGASGKGGGRPRLWLAVVDREAGTSYSQDVDALAAWCGLAPSSLRVYLSRGKARHDFTVERDGRTVPITIRRLSAAENANLAAGHQPTGAELWSA